VLAHALETNHTLISLDLSGACLLYPVALYCQLPQALSRMAHGPWCTGTNIGDQGAQALAKALETNHTLTTLNLSCAFSS
jgi:hypothetical protein